MKSWLQVKKNKCGASICSGHIHVPGQVAKCIQSSNAIVIIISELYPSYKKY